MEVFVVSPVFGFRGYNVSLELQSTVRDLIGLISSKEGFPFEDFYVKHNGRISDQDHKLQSGAVYRLEPRLCGGKGGFGSMLRALGAQIEKTTNREACRDLSGRRLRDVNHEKEMAEWLKKQSEREAEKEQRRLERIQRKLAGPKHQFTDPEYSQQCYELHERLEDSVLKGLQASASGMVNADERQNHKRPATKSEHAAAKKKCFWTGLGDMDSSEADSDEGEAEAPSSTSAAALISGVSCNPQPAVVATTTSRGRETLEAQELTSSSTSSNSSPAPCSPSLERGEREEADSDQPAEQEGEPQSNDGQDTEKAILSETESPGVSYCFPADGAATQPGQPASEGPLDLPSVNAVDDLEALGLERLKVELIQRGMKCGGTLQERAARLFSIKGLSPDQISPALLAKPSKGKKK